MLGIGFSDNHLVIRPSGRMRVARSAVFRLIGEPCKTACACLLKILLPHICGNQHVYQRKSAVSISEHEG